MSKAFRRMAEEIFEISKTALEAHDRGVAKLGDAELRFHREMVMHALRFFARSDAAGKEPNAERLVF